MPRHTSDLFQNKLRLAKGSGVTAGVNGVSRGFASTRSGNELLSQGAEAVVVNSFPGTSSCHKGAEAVVVNSFRERVLVTNAGGGRRLSREIRFR